MKELLRKYKKEDVSDLLNYAVCRCHEISYGTIPATFELKYDGGWWRNAKLIGVYRVKDFQEARLQDMHKQAQQILEILEHLHKREIENA